MPKIPRPTDPFAVVNVGDPDGNGRREVEVAIMPDIDTLMGEGDTRTFLALDASRSMKPMFGDNNIFGSNPNYVQAVARTLGGILARVSGSGKVNMAYWAKGAGDALETMGQFDQDGCKAATVAGPKDQNWGKGTCLLPVVRHIVDVIDKGAKSTLAVIITDGIIQDWDPDCKSYCLQLAKQLKQAYDAGQRPENALKFVLIGVGPEIDVGQLEEIDDLEAEVDMWSSGVAGHMQEEKDILKVVFGELAREDKIIAPSASVRDDKGQEIHSFSDGLPEKFRFVLPRGASAFTVHTAQADVTQDVSEVL